MFEFDLDARDYGVTALENAFIREYLPAAKGDYVKVYLWGLYQCQHPKPDYSLQEMARDLEMSAAEVESALRYWERRSLVSRISEEPPLYRFYSLFQRQQTGHLSDTMDDAYTTFAESVYAAFGDKRKVKPAEIARAWEWVQDIGLPPEVVLMLINHCITLMRPQFSFKRAEALAVAMKQSRVSSAEDADAFLRNDLDIHKGAGEVLRQLGRRGRLPSEPELDLYRKWRMDWHFDHAAIISACKETSKGEPNFAYLDGILNGLRNRTESRTGAAVAQHIQSEQDENARIREVTETLGARISLSMAGNFYRQWRKQFSHEVLLLAARECARSGGKMDTMDKLLTAWAEKGLTTEDAVSDYLAHVRAVDHDLRTLFEACGHEGKVTAADRLLYEKWVSFGMDMALMTQAAQQSREAQGRKIPYLDKVLTAWHEAGIRDVSQTQAVRKMPAPSKTRTVSAQQYTQRTYTEEELGGEALRKLLEEAQKDNG